MANTLVLFFGLTFTFASAAKAPVARFADKEMLCPVCGQTFYARLDLSGAESEMRLDLKPLGVVSWPWLLPDCPKCGFVIYKLLLPAAELAKCKQIVASGEYKKGLPHSSYYRVGLLFDQLGKGDYSVATSFLKASWQEEGSPAKLKEDQELSLKYFTACSQTCGADEKENSLLLMGELLRRLGRFEEAKAHLVKLQGMKGFQKNFFADIVEYQLRQCARKDSSPHEMEDVRDFKRSLVDWIKNRLQKLYRTVLEAGDRETEDSPLSRSPGQAGAGIR